MKILLLIPALGPIYGGTSKVLPELAAALGRQPGMTVDIVTTDANGDANLDVPCGRWVEQDGYRVLYLPRLGRREFKFSLSLFRWLWKHAGDYTAAHIASVFNFPVLAGAVACRWRGVPYMIAPHGMLEPWALGYKARKKKRYLQWIERPLVLRGARRLQALNGREAANLEKLALGPPVVILPNGIDAREAAPIPEEEGRRFLERFPAARDQRVILFLHRVDKKKGLDVLAPAFAAVRRRFPQTHLVVAGPATGDFEGAARGFFHAAGVAEAVTFTGMLDGELKRGALRAAEVFVTPSYSEGFSMSVLEAMAAGLPSVLTEGCNFPEAGAADAARIVPTGDPEAFAAALLALLEESDAARAMGARARQFILANYTWNEVARRAVEVYRSFSP